MFSVRPVTFRPNPNFLRSTECHDLVVKQNKEKLLCLVTGLGGGTDDALGKEPQVRVSIISEVGNPTRFSFNFFYEINSPFCRIVSLGLEKPDRPFRCDNIN